MLNQISKLKGNEIFSLVTPEGMDQYIISRDLIGNVLNVVEDILRKREQHQVVPPPSEDCEDAKRLAKDACSKATLASLNSKEALEKTKHILDILNNVRYKVNMALNKATASELVAQDVSSLRQAVNLLISQGNTLATQVNDLSNSMVTLDELNEAIQRVTENHLADITRINSLLNNQQTSLNEHTSQITNLNQEVTRLKELVEEIIDISPEDLANLAWKVTQLANKEAEDVHYLQAQIDNTNVALHKNDNRYVLTQGQSSVGYFDIPEVDSEVSDISENAISNKAITEFILQKEQVIANALVNLNNKIQESDTSIEEIQEYLEEIVQKNDNKELVIANALTDLDSRLNTLQTNNTNLLSENESLQQQVTTLSNALSTLEGEIFCSVTGDNNDNPITKVIKGTPLNITLPVSAGDKSTLQSATITMSGQDITSSCYNSSTREISIPTVTGPVVITTDYGTNLEFDDIFGDDNGGDPWGN